MKFVNFGILVVFLPKCLCLTLTVPPTVVKESVKELGLTCENGTLQPNEFFAAGLKSCDMLHGPGKQNSADCIYFCYAEVMGTLNDDGEPTWENYQNLITKVIPTEHQEMTTTWFKDCWDRYGSKIDRQDVTCAMANQFSIFNWKLKPLLKC